jgi:hypothetical protein
MFDKILALYTQGDIAQLSENILHSTSWKQHDFTAHGNMQIQSLWLKSLAQFGFLTLTKKQQVKGKNFSAIYFEISSENIDKSISLTLTFEHNERHIKKLHCIVDTVKLAHLLSLPVEQIITQLPSPDPLFLSQFDHQMHPKSYHALPNDVGEMPKGIGSKVTLWWQIWQEKNLASFDKIYSADVDINIAGMNEQQAKGMLAMRKFQLDLHNYISRSYCQLQRLCFDVENNSVAIEWHIDGDSHTGKNIKRIRIPVISIIVFNDDNMIVSEQFQVDWLALCKSYNLTYPLL